MLNYDGLEFVNCGSGVEITIKDLALLVKEIVGYEGEIVHDTTKPDGTPRKLTDVSKIHELGWKHTINLREGIASVYKEFSENYDAIINKYKA
jgi:GDP-L-fucose synthase